MTLIPFSIVKYFAPSTVVAPLAETIRRNENNNIIRVILPRPPWIHWTCRYPSTTFAPRRTRSVDVGRNSSMNPTIFRYYQIGNRLEPRLEQSPPEGDQSPDCVGIRREREGRTGGTAGGRREHPPRVATDS